MSLDKFRKYDGTVVNAGEYVKDFLRTNPGSRIVVGCDSQHNSGNIQYAVIIALFYSGTKGANLIYRKFNKPMKKTKISLYERIWAEIETARETAQELEDLIWESGIIEEMEDYDSMQNFVKIHIDVNQNPRYKSNVLLNSAVGYLTGLGFHVTSKPQSWVASCAADIYCK